MTFSGVGHFKWPEAHDEMWYKKEDVLEVIPITANKSGAFQIPEMLKYANRQI